MKKDRPRALRSDLYLPFVAGLAKRDPVAVDRLLTSDDYTPADLLAFAYRNSLPGYVYMMLDRLDQLDRFPGELVRELESFYRERQLSTCRLLFEEMVNVRSRLEADGLAAIFIKGPFLAQRFYGRYTDRLFWDTDLLVRGRRDLERCDAALLDMGYRRRSKRLLGYRLPMHFAHDLEYDREWRKLDLHWRLGAHYSFRVDEERMWSSSTTMSVQNQPFAVLSEEYVLVLLLLALFNDSQRGKLRAKGLIDTYMVLSSVERSMDWAGFFQRRAEERILKISCTLLNLALNVLDCRSEFPGLADQLDGFADHIQPSDRECGLWLLERSPNSLDNKFWTLRLFESGFWSALLWYAASQPVKRVVYR
jgi:hypothetical protein